MRDKKTEIVLTIKYTVDIEDLNSEEILDKLRERGAAEIVDIELPETNERRK